ncbi:hypothetical protein [Catenulispora subtropica]|uniref:hypothetical protein n=1 Tax=Catenulispora subtropica TaxID=450798 RepID=UPI0031D3DEBD
MTDTSLIEVIKSSAPRADAIFRGTPLCEWIAGSGEATAKLEPAGAQSDAALWQAL